MRTPKESRIRRGPRSVREILAEIDRRAPAGTAEDWDNVGLLAGDPSWATQGATVSIDLTAKALADARRRGHGLIVTHHPCIFPGGRGRGLGRITAGQQQGELGSLIVEALRARIAVAACHTNFDQCSLEVVQAVAKGLGVEPCGRLIDHGRGSLRKLVTFAPAAQAARVREALCAAGAGTIGNYDQCSFAVRGEGTFRGGPGTDPFLGTPGVLEMADEIRIETVFPKGLERSVLKALFDSHPYEEVAFDIYPVEQAPVGKGLQSGLGYGFWGEFAASRPFSDVAKDVRSLFKVDGFWLTDPPPRRVKRLAFAAGKGSAFVEPARSAGCELFITGEAGYHSALDASRKGMAVLEIGHRESELFFVSTMSRWLADFGLRVSTVNPPSQKIWTSRRN